MKKNNLILLFLLISTCIFTEAPVKSQTPVEKTIIKRENDSCSEHNNNAAACDSVRTCTVDVTYNDNSKETKEGDCLFLQIGDMSSCDCIFTAAPVKSPDSGVLK